MEDGRREGTRSRRSGGQRERERAALAGTGAAFSGLSTFFNARRQLSQSSIPPLSLSLVSSSSSIFYLFGSFFSFFFRFLRFPRAPSPSPTHSPPSAAASTDGFFHYVYTIAKNDSAFSRSSAFQKTVRARVRPVSTIWLRINAVEFMM